MSTEKAREITPVSALVLSHVWLGVEPHVRGGEPCGRHSSADVRQIYSHGLQLPICHCSIK